MNELQKQINAVVEAREKARGANEARVTAYTKWLEKNQHLFDTEKLAMTACDAAESGLRILAVASYIETGEKAVAPGVGIRVMSRLNYENKDAIEWALEHKLALKLDTSAFEKIAKTSNLPFVDITEVPQATIATELNRI